MFFFSATDLQRQVLYGQLGRQRGAARAERDGQQRTVAEREDHADDRPGYLSARERFRSLLTEIRDAEQLSFYGII